MKAMILAAGLGTRLRPLTDDRPKALVDIAGRTPLELALTRLREFGIRDVIINTHHFADVIAKYLADHHKNFGMTIEISREDELLDTGGGLKKAAYFFLDSSSADEPFILHNVDVISNIDLGRMVKFHTERQALATLAVQDRKTSRYLLFDKTSQLCGRKSGKDDTTELVRQAQHLNPLAFNGIHVISPRFLSMMTEEGAFSIIATYLRLAASGETILGFRADEYHWRDLGTPGGVAQAALDLSSGRISA
jgi:NDP-sugar pyrophosphorylase family protein